MNAPHHSPADALSLRTAITIFQKEFREIFRDRRTLMSVVIGPLVITPVLFAIIGLGIRGQIEGAKTKVYPVGVVGLKAESPVMTGLKKTPNFTFSSQADATVAEKEIRDHNLKAALILPPDAAVRLMNGEAVDVTILSDSGDQDSLGAAGALNALFQKQAQEITVARLKARNLPDDFARPFKVTEKTIASGRGQAMLFLGSMLPYLLILAAFGGAIYAAFDQVAGEKERGTLETLLVSAASRKDIVLGKFAAVVMVCLLSSVLSIVGLIIPFASGLKAFEWIAKGGLTLEPSAILVILLALLPLSVLFAGILLAVSTFSRNQKEAQTYLGSLFPIVIVPAMYSMFMGSEISLGIALVPILNAGIIIKQALNGNYNFAFILTAFAASVLYAGLSLLVATRLFQKESILIKT